MRHLDKVDKDGNKKTGLSRRGFLTAAIASGALAVGGILANQNDILAQSIERLGGDRWEITIDGKVIMEGLLNSETREELLLPVQNGIARIVFDHGRIYMPEDNDICEKKICSLMGSIMKSGEKITCLPNKLVIRIL